MEVVTVLGYRKVLGIGLLDSILRPRGSLRGGPRLVLRFALVRMNSLCVVPRMTSTLKNGLGQRWPIHGVI